MPPPSMPYTRHSTLPPNFPAGAPMYERAGTPTYGPPGQMLNVPFGSPYDVNRRNRSVTPYAPTTSSNLAYAQPVIAPPVDLMAAYPTPISANDGSAINYGLDIVPMPMPEVHPDMSEVATPIPTQQSQMGMGMDLSMEQQMQMQMQMPMEMQMQSHDYGGMQYDVGPERGAAWGWTSYEPGNYPQPQQQQQVGDGSMQYRE